MANDIRLPLFETPEASSYMAPSERHTHMFVACPALLHEHSRRWTVFKIPMNCEVCRATVLLVLYFCATRRRDAVQKIHLLCSPFRFVGKRGSCYRRVFQEAEYHPADPRSNRSLQVIYLLCEHCVLQPEYHNQLELWRYDSWRLDKTLLNSLFLANCAANPDFIPVASGGDGSSTQFCKLKIELLSCGMTNGKNSS